MASATTHSPTARSTPPASRGSRLCGRERCSRARGWRWWSFWRGWRPSLPESFGLAATLVLCAIMALGFAYGSRFKGTWVSALLFALHFPLLPIFVWVALGVWQPFLPWILPLGAALGIAMNIANSLPYLDDDIAAGVRGLPTCAGGCAAISRCSGILVALSLLIWLLGLTGLAPGLPLWLLLATLVAVGTPV